MSSFNLLSWTGVFNQLLVFLMFLLYGCGIMILADFRNMVANNWKEHGIDVVAWSTIMGSWYLVFLLPCVWGAQYVYFTLVESIIDEYDYHIKRDPNYKPKFSIYY